MAAAPSPDRLAARLRFRHLQLLLALQRGGTLRAAAVAMNLTQPALSKALGEIEAAFGARLFERSPRGVAPTERGRLALQGAQVLLAGLAHVQQEVTAPQPAALLRIGAPPFVAHGYLPDVLLRLTQGPDAMQVALLEERVPALLRALADGRVEALVSSFPAEPPADLGVELVHEKLFDARYLVIAPAGHALARKAKVAWRQLAQERWVLPAWTAMVRRVLEDCFVREGLKAPQPVVESTSPTTNVELVAHGLGIGVVPAVAATAALREKRIARLKVVPDLPAGPVALIRRAGPLHPRVAVLRDLLVSLH